ncbi:MAG: iron ABC transporter permease [Coriobacteriia bacterium]|nr:iron ABC transporter permease [Coriobacteriia bacterium]MCL2750254.1 iron ABC transporter permease [Coriobacteriia bacterium]
MKRPIVIVAIYVLTALLLVGLFFFAVNQGSIKVTFPELLRGLFVEYDPNVAAVYDLRFPRILIALFGGAALAVAGALFQAVLRNPVADPSIIGISSGAALASALVVGLFPMLYFSSPFFAIAGGLITFIIVYTLSFRGGLAPMRVILVGIAVNAVLVGLGEGIGVLMSGGAATGGGVSLTGSLAMKTWSDVRLLVLYVTPALLLAGFMSARCNLLKLDDDTVRSLGVNVTTLRIIISLIAVTLVSVASAVMGVIAFLGLIVPHLARILVGSDNRVMLPYCVLGGAFVMLLADTAGRLIAFPYEIHAGILMALIGGPLFIILLSRKNTFYGS